ncbi:P-loop containing nucleoside triphosphate hydrolase protein [Fomitopsis serialis]|uniref:P-loop containing nucleoside triphosphate hydrolase protein n=1 Tax=Fomitopsis serialis TaxID=139415 RepID=UPI002008C9F2|nr:P-loop containing nucleoside triphosphate hydrolase protein [Neoantrodia serialis]KAH9930264.1 P-loop containing nucleoside triphosphate hydrolase protein [Neoantrodia serialis]
METFKNLLSPFSSASNPLQDTLKLVVVGGTLETARRVSVSAWNGFIDSFFLTAHFSQEDYPYDWLMHWLAKQPAWGRSREFDITTRTISRNGLTQSTTGDLDDEEADDGEVMMSGRKKRKVAIVPSLDTTHTIYYRGHWLRITRTKRFQDYGSYAEIKICVVARNNDILKKLVLEAKREYEKDAVHRVHIYMADTTYGGWRWNGARQKRPMSSIVLEPGVKDMILADCQDFLCSEEWYAERGIPFRRGYLLHGVPGSGKTSLIHSLAGELGLDIYVISLSAKGMSDNMLATLMGNIPSRCILLLEDLDAAFTRGVSRDDSSTGAPTSSTSTSSSTSTAKTKDESNDGSTLTLSGLLNSLDGVAAAEGRLLFATTNHIERLDPALSRPGRMDVWVNFKHASKWQAEGIFKCFFPAKPSSNGNSPTSAASAKPDDEAPSAEGLAVPKRKKAAYTAPLLSEEEISDLAKRFADAMPEDELSVAALQGYLLKNKTRPRECVDEAVAWVAQERETRAKLKKEKEEREAKEKKEAEEAAEKAKKEAEEKAKKEADEKVATEKPAEVTEVTKDTASVSEPTSSSNSADANKGADTDLESSVISVDETGAVNSSETQDGKEKWVAVKADSPDPGV